MEFDGCLHQNCLRIDFVIPPVRADKANIYSLSSLSGVVTMPSPIAHSVSAYAVSKLWPESKILLWKQRRGASLSRWFAWNASPRLLLYVVFIAVSPDLDFVPQILTGDRYHHGPTHSIMFAVGTAIVSWLASGWLGRRSRQIALLALVVYLSHLALDLVTKGGDGIQLLWPFSQSYYQSPLLIFPSTGWSKGLFDPQHFVFLAFELGYSALVLLGLSRLNKKGRKPLPRAD